MVKRGDIYKLMGAVEIITRHFGGYDFDWEAGTYREGPKERMIWNLMSPNTSSGYTVMSLGVQKNVEKAIDFYVMSKMNIDKEGTC